MQPARMVCEGVGVGSYHLPSFQLRGGDLICLHLPGPVDWDAEATLIRILTGKESVSGVRLSGRVVHAPRATPRDGFWRLLGQPTLAHWLANNGGVSLAEATRQIEEFGLSATVRLDHVAGTPRLFLGLAKVWNRGAEAIVFSMSGLDPLGRIHIMDAVRARLNRCPAILLSYPYITNGETERDCPPGALCLGTSRVTAA